MTRTDELYCVGYGYSDYVLRAQNIAAVYAKRDTACYRTHGATDFTCFGDRSGSFSGGLLGRPSILEYHDHMCTLQADNVVTCTGGIDPTTMQGDLRFGQIVDLAPAASICALSTRRALSTVGVRTTQENSARVTDTQRQQPKRPRRPRRASSLQRYLIGAQ